jgi:hypothetical protein
VLVSSVPSIQGLSLEPECARGAIQTKHFIHDVNQQVETAFKPNEILQERSNRIVPVFTTALNSGDGGDRRDRTDDLKLAKLPLYQLSYVPSSLSSQAKRVVPRRNHGGPGKT